MFNSKNLGQAGEKFARKFLKKNGFSVLDKNFQNESGIRMGEIDIIAFDKKEEEIVFVEVKTRLGAPNKDVIPEENITFSKLKKLEKIAQIYLTQKKLTDKPYRFDAVSVIIKDKKPFIYHIKGL